MHLEKYVTIDEFLSSNYKNPDFYDPLTGLISRKYILDYVQFLMKKNTPFYISILDVDNFKLVNDNYGHTIGDELIKQFSKNLLEYTNNKSVVGRIGGDEFLIVNVGMTEHEQIKDFYQKIYQQKEIVRKDYNMDGNTFYITSTSGAASFPNNSTDFAELFNMADKALYKGKAKGRNCYVIYIHEMHKDININELANKKPADVMDDVTDAFVRDRNFESAIKVALDKTVEIMGFTGAFYLDENLNLITTASYGVKKVTEFDWYDFKQIVDENNLLNLHHIDYMKDINLDIYNYLMKYRVVSLLLKKVRFATGNFGYIAFTDSARSRVWQDDDITILTYIEKLIGIHKTYKLK